MPLPLIGGLVAAGGQLLSNQQNAAATFDANLQQQMFSERMYERTRRDNLEFWKMQNHYNSPAEQMQRFTDAGLSPYLIYGQGNAGNASSIPTPDVQSVNYRAPEYKNVAPDLMALLLGQADLKIKNAQADNLQAQNDVIRQDALLKSLQYRRGEFDLNFETELRPYSADARREQARQYRVQNDVTVNRDAREASMNASNLSEAVERMRNLRIQSLKAKADTAHTYKDIKRLNSEIRRIDTQIDLMRKDGTLKDIEIKLREAGVNPNDPMYQRYIGMILENLFDTGVSGGFLDMMPYGSWKR